MNRINLLKKEEEKTIKKIGETKKKTNKVISLKKNNVEMQTQVRYLFFYLNQS